MGVPKSLSSLSLPCIRFYLALAIHVMVNGGRVGAEGRALTCQNSIINNDLNLEGGRKCTIILTFHYRLE